MLDSIKIRNFKSIKYANLSFGRVNMFIGANGAGKSNVLEAIGILSAALGRGVMPADLDYKGVRLSLPHLFKSTFKNRETPKTFGLNTKLGEVEYAATFVAGEDSSSLSFRTERLIENGNKILGRGPRGAKIHSAGITKQVEGEFIDLDSDRSAYNALSAFSKISDESVRQLNQISKYVIFTPQTAVMRGLVPDNRSVEPLGLTGGRLAIAFAELLKDQRKFRREKKIAEADFIDKAIEIIWKPGWADQMKTGPLDPHIVPSHVAAASEMIYIRDRFMKSGRNYLSPYDASEGTLYLIFVATLLAHRGAPKIFALDNVDGTLNPGLVKVLIEHIVKIVCKASNKIKTISPRQVFLTSHNPTALDALDIFNPDHRIFIVSRDEQDGGVTKFTPLLPPKDFDKEKWINASGGKSLSRLWLDERFPEALG